MAAQVDSQSSPAKYPGSHIPVYTLKATHVSSPRGGFLDLTSIMFCGDCLGLGQDPDLQTDDLNYTPKPSPAEFRKSAADGCSLCEVLLHHIENGLPATCSRKSEARLRPAVNIPAVVNGPREVFESRAPAVVTLFFLLLQTLVS